MGFHREIIGIWTDQNAEDGLPWVQSNAHVLVSVVSGSAWREDSHVGSGERHQPFGLATALIYTAECLEDSGPVYTAFFSVKSLAQQANVRSKSRRSS